MQRAKGADPTDASPGFGRDAASTILSVFPWLGVPVLISAALAKTGRPLPGEILPVIAFLPLTGFAYMVALRLPIPVRAWAIGLPGSLAVVGLLTFLARDPGPGVGRTFAAAVAAATISTGAAAALGRLVSSARPLATPAAAAPVFGQSLDGWLTYFAVANPLGWLPEAVSERVLISRILLELAPPLFPLLKVALGVAVVLMLLRHSPQGTLRVLVILAVSYVGFSPAMFSAANLFTG